MTAVKDYRWDIQFLQQMAAHYLGQPVIVELVNDTGWRGEATKCGRIARIRLGTDQDVSQLDYSFWHELAHLRLHQFTTDSAGTTHDLKAATTAAKAKPSNALLELMRLKIAQEEQEADELALQMRTDFEKRFKRTLTNCARIVGPMYA